MISVIMSCHKSNKEYLKEAVLSILNQTYEDFEFLIADNGAGFDLKEFLSQFKDKRIKFIDNGGNIGAAVSYDKLADLAQGEYVAIQDHDDISNHWRLQVQKNALDLYKEVQSVSSCIMFLGGRKDGKVDGEEMPPERVKEELIFWQPIKQPTFMKRREFAQKYKYNPDYFIYDYEFWSRVRDIPHLILGNVLLEYRKSELNSSKERAQKVREEHAEIIQQNLLLLGISLPIETCKLLDPYCHTKQNIKFMISFLACKEKLLKHITKELYERKVVEMCKKIAS